MSQIKPLAMASPHSTVANGDEGPMPKQCLHTRHRRLFCCLGCGGVLVVLLGTAVLVVALVFKIEDPTLTLNSVRVVDFANGTDTSSDQRFSANVTLLADMSLKNPNAVTFRYNQSTTEFYHQGQTVGEGLVPKGKVHSDRTTRMNMTIDVFVKRLSNLTMLEPMELKSYTAVRGKTRALGVFKRHLEIMLNCSMILDVSFSSAEENKKNTNQKIPNRKTFDLQSPTTLPLPVTKNLQQKDRLLPLRRGGCIDHLLPLRRGGLHRDSRGRRHEEQELLLPISFHFLDDEVPVDGLFLLGSSGGAKSTSGLHTQ